MNNKRNKIKKMLPICSEFDYAKLYSIYGSEVYFLV